MFNCCNCPCTLLRNNPFKLFSCPVNVWYVHCTLHSQVLGIRIFFDQTRIQLLKNMQLVTIYTLINIEIKYMLYNVLCCIIFSSLVLQMTSHYRNFGMLYGSLKIHTIHVTSPCVVLVYTTRLLKEVFISASLFFKLELGLWNICKKQSFQKQVLYFPKIILKNLILCLHLCLGCWLYVHWSLVVPLLPLPPILGPLLLSLTGYD